MVRYRFLTATLVVAGLLASGAAFAQGPFGRGGRLMGPGGAGPSLRGLNLTDAQRDQVREIRERYQRDSEDAIKRLAEARARQREAIEAIPANETLVTSATQDMVQAEVDVAVQRARLNNEIWAVLTPEQQEQAKKLRAERQSRLEQRRERLQERRERMRERRR